MKGDFIMKNKIVSLVGLSLLVALAGCTDNKESAKESTTVPPMTETSHPSTEPVPPVTETAPVTESTPNTEGVSESTPVSTEPEVEEPTELMDSTAEELIARIKTFAEADSYSMSYEIDGKTYRDVVAENYIFFDNLKKGYVLLPSFDVDTTRYEKIVYNFSVDNDGTVVQGMPAMYDGGYYKAYMKDLSSITTMKSFAVSRYASLLAASNFTEEEAYTNGAWAVNLKSSGGYSLMSLLCSITGYSQLINYEFHLFSDGSLKMNLLHYKANDKGGYATDEDGNRIIETVATFTFSEAGTAKETAVEARFANGLGEKYVPKEFKLMQSRPLTFDATLKLVDKTGVEATTVAGKSKVIINENAEEYDSYDANGTLTSQSQYFNVDGIATMKYLAADNTIKSMKLTSSSTKKDLKWADAKSTYSFLLSDPALIQDPNNSNCYTYIDGMSAGSIVDMFSTFMTKYDLYGEVTSLRFFKNADGVIDSIKAVLSDGGMGNLKTQFHYEIDIAMSVGEEVKVAEPLTADADTKTKFDAALAKLDGTHNVSMTYGSKRDETAEFSNTSEQVVSVEGEDKLDSYLNFTLSGGKITDLKGYKADGENGFIPFKKIRSGTEVRATGADKTDVSFKDLLGFNVNSNVFVKNDDGSYTVSKKVNYEYLDSYLPFDSLYNAGNTLKFFFNDAGDAIEKVTYTISSSYFGDSFVQWTFKYGADVTVDADFSDSVNNLTAFETPTNWKDYFKWAVGLTAYTDYYADMVKYFRFAGDKFYAGKEEDAVRTTAEAEALVEKLPFVWYAYYETSAAYISTQNYSDFAYTKDGVEGKAKRFTLYMSIDGKAELKADYYTKYVAELAKKGFTLLAEKDQIATSRAKAINASSMYVQYLNKDSNLLIELVPSFEKSNNYIYITDLSDSHLTFTANK